MLHICFTVPDHSGVYLILQGTVEKLSMDPETKILTSDIVRIYPIRAVCTDI